MHDTDDALFRAVHGIAGQLAGQPVPVVMEALVRQLPKAPGLDLAVIRDIVDSNHKASTEPEGVTYAEVDAGGVPALWAIPEGADPDRALLHFHFGGSVTASMHSDRKAAGHIAKAAGARSLVVDFRLAPEHPYPAQLDDAETAYRWLLKQGYQPQNIGSTGHSIGGTLAVMLPLRLLANGEPTPRCDRQHLAIGRLHPHQPQGG